MSILHQWNIQEHSWSRRCSTETIFSIQGKETDIARDTSDTEALDSDTLEYEPVTESEEDGPLDADSSDGSDSELIKTKVVEVCVREGDLVFADSEHTESASGRASSGSDGELDYHDYWHCAQCRVANNNPLYRYCQKCYKNRKNFFPPRPRRKHKRENGIDPSISSSQPMSQYSSMASQPLSQDSGVCSPQSQELETDPQSNPSHSKNHTVRKAAKKRRSESVDRLAKRPKYSSSDSESDDENVQRLAKTISDPGITIEDTVITKKVIANSIKEIERVDAKELCVICINEPKSGVFVHGRIAHICCCYNCAKKVWAKAKRCPVCNCKISNVLKAVVM